jgi:hypothetical protein
MQRSKGFLNALIGAVSALGLLSASGVAFGAEDLASGPVVASSWQHHKAGFSYFGITSLYSCDGLENNIRSLLLYLGARKDLTVSAQGCPNGPSVPGRNALVSAEFWTLSANDGNGAADSVQARWAPVTVSARRPYFMDHGDCELIEQMKDLISKNFSLRDLDYRTNCVPHEVTLDDFSVKAQALKAVPALSGAAKG